MKNRIMKKKASIGAAMLISIMLLAACGGGSGSGSAISVNPGNVYRVIVRDESGNGVEGAVVQFCSDTMCMTGETDAEGIAIFENQAEGVYTVHVYSVPDGFEEDPSEYDAPEKYGDVNITLKADK